MTYDWEKLNRIFHQALACAPDERAAFIRKNCAGDAELRDEALALLASHEDDNDGFMEKPPLAGANLAEQFGNWQGRIVGSLQNAGQPALQMRPPDYLIGQLLDEKYKIEERRGQGGMGAVYLATHQGTGRRVAIKIIAPEFMANPEFVERFRREAKAAGMLNHPNVVNVTDFGLSTQPNAQRIAYLVMEYLEGLTLADLLKERRGLQLEEVVHILEQVCRAIDEAHGAGILHRDLKPENIWLEPLRYGGYHVKVLDFGLAKLRDVTPEQASAAAAAATKNAPPLPASAIPNRTRLLSDEEAHTLLRVFSAPQQQQSTDAPNDDERKASEDDNDDEAFERAATRPTLGQLDTRTSPHWFSRTGMVLGTPTYMSPEQCRGERLDTASDIYSLGVIAYQMLAGETPFAGTTHELLSKHKEMPPPSLMERYPALPAGVAEAVAGALSKERGRRFATAGAFACALRLGAEGDRAIRREASAVYQKHRWLFLKAAALAHAPVIFVALLLLLGVVLLPVMSAPVSLVVFATLWLTVLFLTLYGNAATTAACTLVVEKLPEAAQSRGTAKKISGAVRREALALAVAIAAGISDAVRELLSFRRDGWRAYFDSSLLIPSVITEKLRGREALDRAKKLGAHVRKLSADIRALHLAALLFSLLAYQAVLLVMGLLVDAVYGTTPLPDRINSVFVIWMPLTLILIVGLILMQVRTSIEHAVLYLKARKVSGERAGTHVEAAAYPETTKLEQARVPHGRAIALAGMLALAVFGWHLFKQEVMFSSIENGSVNIVKAAHASGMPVPLWSEGPRPAIGFLLQRPAMVKLLLDKGADINARVRIERGWVQPYQKDLTTTPLMSALTFDAVNSARMLLERGADIHVEDSNNRTPLMVAAIYSPAAVDLLLKHGADINGRTSKGTALLSAARYRGIYDASSINEEDLGKGSNVVARLLDKGANANDSDEEGRTPLMVMSMEYRPDRVILPIAEALLSAGADINARDRNGRTPLMYAVRHRQRATIEFLLRHGADASAKDNSGINASELAKQLGFDDIARTLLNSNLRFEMMENPAVRVESGSRER
jgi:serine/threonine protein kinase/ankyrin repeat protein